MTKIYFSSSTKIEKKVSDVTKKKYCFLEEVKTSLQSTKTLAPLPERLNYVTVFSVKAVLPWKLQLRLEIQVQCRLLNIFW